MVWGLCGITHKSPCQGGTYRTFALNIQFAHANAACQTSTMNRGNPFNRYGDYSKISHKSFIILILKKKPGWKEKKQKGKKAFRAGSYSQFRLCKSSTTQVEDWYKWEPRTDPWEDMISVFKYLKGYLWWSTSGVVGTECRLWQAGSVPKWRHPRGVILMGEVCGRGLVGCSPLRGYGRLWVSLPVRSREKLPPQKPF